MRAGGGDKSYAFLTQLDKGCSQWTFHIYFFIGLTFGQGKPERLSHSSLDSNHLRFALIESEVVPEAQGGKDQEGENEDIGYTKSWRIIIHYPCPFRAIYQNHW